MRYFFYFEFRQKVHVVYFWPHLLFWSPEFPQNRNVVSYSYYDGNVLISNRWRYYQTRKLKKSVFSIFFKSNLVVHLNEHDHIIYITYIIYNIYNIYIYIFFFSDKEKQLFWNWKFHAVLLIIFSQLLCWLQTVDKTA